MPKTDIKSLLPEELAAFLAGLGQKPYRAAQIFSWLHRGTTSFDEMTDIPNKLRIMLKDSAYISMPVVKKRLVSSLDSTVKYLYTVYAGEDADGQKIDAQDIETVLMSYHYGETVCISSQAGCRMGCAFCASTVGGLERSLQPSEMLDQVLFTGLDSGRRISHVVLMGIGEPLDNYENVVKFIKILSAPGGLNLSPRNISLSTCGVVANIYRLMEEKIPLTLSISLHAPNDEIRSRLMPVNKKWNVDTLLSACREYADKTKRRISFEYAMIGGLNDSDVCARELASKITGMLCHVNLIPVNEARGGFYRSKRDRIEKFSGILENKGISVTVRRTLGSDINASCGQLRRGYGE